MPRRLTGEQVRAGEMRLIPLSFFVCDAVVVTVEAHLPICPHGPQARPGRSSDCMLCCMLYAVCVCMLYVCMLYVLYVLYVCMLCMLYAVLTFIIY